MIPLDPTTWERTALVEKYAPYTFPYINMGADLDVTGLYRFAKEEGLSFYCAMIHTAVSVALDIRNFSYRLVDGQPMLCERLDPELVHMPPGGEQFAIVRGTFEDDLISFCRHTAEQMARVTEGEIQYGHSKSEEILYITCIPWVKYTHFVRTFEDPRTDTIPRLSWGKFEPDARGRLMMPFSVQVHHALVDGYHVGMYFQRIQEKLDAFG